MILLRASTRRSACFGGAIDLIERVPHQRCAGQMSAVTGRLKAMASLEGLTEIRASIEKSATELKTSIDRMTAEGKEALEHLQEQVASYQTKLEEAEEIASRDALTGLSSRLYVEGQMEKRIGSGLSILRGSYRYRWL